LMEEDKQKDVDLFRKHAHTNRALGDEKFLTKLEMITGMVLKKRKPGPKGNN
ncbi:unnamed protein product, partial [marine sediment metagenome]